MASTLGTAAESSVNLINGAQACNVFWQVGSSATLGADSSLAGNILALTSITVGTGTTVEGRTLARDGSVTLETNTITRSVCTADAPEDTTTTTTALAPGDTTATFAPGDTTTTITPGDVTASGDATATNLATPVGGVGTGGGSTSGAPNMTLLFGGLAFLAAAVGAFVVRRRLQNRQSG